MYEGSTAKSVFECSKVVRIEWGLKKPLDQNVVRNFHRMGASPTLSHGTGKKLKITHSSTTEL